MSVFVDQRRQDSSDLARARHLYEHDYYTWVEEQVACLREGRIDAIDFENVAEELSDMGKAHFYRMHGSLKILVMHMLKWDQQAEHRSASWEGSIREHRRRIKRLLDKNPGLKPRIPEALAEGYEDAKVWAAIETGLPEEDFPQACPYSWADVMDRSFEIDSQPSGRSPTRP